MIPVNKHKIVFHVIDIFRSQQDNVASLSSLGFF
jgi:hypothetical protein